MSTSLTSITTLAIVLFSLLGYSFISAQWTNAPSSPPANNAAAPINVSATNQVKAGGLGAGRFIANWDMRSPFYCDENGANCFSPANVGGAVSCELDMAPQSVCAYSVSELPACPVGYVQIGPISNGGDCSTNNQSFSRECVRVVCN